MKLDKQGAERASLARGKRREKGLLCGLGQLSTLREQTLARSSHHKRMRPAVLWVAVALNCSSAFQSIDKRHNSGSIEGGELAEVGLA